MFKKIRDKFTYYKQIENMEETFTNFFEVKSIFQNPKIRDFIFEPFKDVFKIEGNSSQESNIKRVITLVAISNMVMAGLPGKMGIGVSISMMLEGWMAFEIARNVGISINNVRDVWKYFGFISGILSIILFGFRHLLGFAFSLFSLIPYINPMILSELFVTNLVGMFFWFGFEELKQKGVFKVPLKSLKQLFKKTQYIYQYQIAIVGNLFNKENIKLIGKRLQDWFKGDIGYSCKGAKGEIFHFVAMVHLIEGNFGTLEGPLGEVFIQSIRRAYSDKLGDASVEEMSDFFSQRTPEQLQGDISLVKGEMFEHIVEINENSDEDNIVASLHDSRTVEGSDIIFTNMNTGENIEISLKSVASPTLIEKALEKYPTIPIITTEEMHQFFGDNPLVSVTGVNNSELKNVTKENFQELTEKITPLDIASNSAIPVAMATLWPFTIAYMKKKIDKAEFLSVFSKVLGASGQMFVSRLSWAIVLGPIFAWYLLARSVILIVKEAEKLSNVSDKQKIKRKILYLQ